MSPPSLSLAVSRPKPFQVVGDDGDDIYESSRDRDPAASRFRRRSKGIVPAIDTNGRVASAAGASHRLTTAGGPFTMNLHSTSASGPSELTLPLLSPAAASASTAYSPERYYYPHQPKSLSGISLRAFCLGGGLAVGLIGTTAILTLTSSALWRIFFFLAALSTFHFLEFWTTATYNTSEADIDSFLLTANWPAYAIAHSAATFECLVTNLIWPHKSWAPFHTGPLLLTSGLLMVLVGQVVRSVAMAHAGQSFNHTVQHYKRREHVLVTTGIYSTLRHPSYFGFFWWAMGTQLVLGNVVCFFGYWAVLHYFFSTRIRAEEASLVRFFGDEYVEYRKRVGTKLPFIR